MARSEVVSARRIHQRLTVAFDFPVEFTEDVFRPENDTLFRVVNRLGEERRHRAMVYLDANVATGLPERIRKYFDAYPAQLELVGAPRIVPGGEAAKTHLSTVEAMIAEMLEAHLDRHAFVIAIGGGAVLDAVGLAASLVHRGLRMVRLPTTVLAQNDAGVGVKTGMDFAGGKNAIGTFCPPFAVVNDSSFLKTLPDHEWIAGISEAFKVAIIRDRAFFERLLRQAAALRARDMAAMEDLIHRCAEAHLDHMRTSGDPFELGRARPLDFGHWSAHKLELMSNFRIAHGEAVGVGILLDSRYAVSRGLLSDSEFARIREGMERVGLPCWFDELDRRGPDGRREVLGGLRDFQEHLGGKLCITLPCGIGDRVEVEEIDERAMEDAIDALREARRPSWILD
jgi:3-dehydroquinate synthase